MLEIWKKRNNLSSKYSQKLIDHAKKSATDAFKIISIRVIQRAAETTGDLTGNEIANRITKVSKTLPQNSSEVNIENDTKIHTERYISPKQRQKTIDDLGLI